jgi:hypothetical protein
MMAFLSVVMFLCAYWAISFKQSGDTLSAIYWMIWTFMTYVAVMRCSDS